MSKFKDGDLFIERVRLLRREEFDRARFGFGRGIGVDVLIVDSFDKARIGKLDTFSLRRPHALDGLVEGDDFMLRTSAFESYNRVSVNRHVFRLTQEQES